MTSMCPPETPGSTSSNMLPPPTPTTDFALIESQKENIRPLATGRSAATLSTLFEKDSEADRLLNEGHERYRALIAEAERRDKEGEDMVDEVVDLLDAYHQHVQWAAQHHTSNANYFLPLIETATRRFEKDARYAQDTRYLKMWVQYTRYTERREEIWAFLESRNICTNHALFYEEWAAACEGLGRKKKADEIFRLGLARKAGPVERLKLRHEQYLQRILVASSRDIPDDEVLVPSRSGGRSVLGQVSTTPSVSGAVQLAPSNRLSKSNNGAKMDIFVDSAGKSGQDDGPSEWAELGSRDARRKENTIESTPWKGETMPQKGAAPRTPKPEVFKDVGSNQDAIRSAEEALFKPKQLTEAELLRADPLRHYDTANLSTEIPTIPAPPPSRKPHKSKSGTSSKAFVPQGWEFPTDGQVITDAKGKKERRMFDWNMVYKNGEEWSMEEIRARQRGLLGKQWKGDVQEWERGWHKPGSSTPKPAEKTKKMPSPTVNTKLANEEIMAMFDQTIHGGKSRRGQGDSDDSDNDSDDSGDSDDDIIQSAPTPLPARAGPSMMTPMGAFVPPTPTPAQGYVAQHRNVVPMVFQDENVVPASASKPARINVFSETPAKTPLAARTPLSASASKPRAFEAFSDAPPIVNDENAVPPQQSQSRPVNIFATPAIKGPARRGVFSNAILEEEEEPKDSNADQPLDHVVENADEYVDAEDDENRYGQGQWKHIAGGYNIMTPITERTQEFTQMTNLRSSQTTNIFSNASSGLQSSTRSVYQDNEGVLPKPRTAPLEVLQEQERPVPVHGSGREGTDSPDDSLMFGTSDMGSVRDHSSMGSFPEGFGLPEGYTIHNRPQNDMEQHTMVITDQHNQRNEQHQRHEQHPDMMTSRTDTNTMHTANDHGSGETESHTDDAFVTANHGPVPESSLSSDQVDIPNPCVPIDDAVIEKLLSIVQPPLSYLPNFQDMRNQSSNRLASLQSYSKSKARRSSSAPRQSIAADDNMSIELGDRVFEVADKIGEGGFGAVFLAVDVKLREQIEDADSDDEDEDDDDELDRSLVAIKVEKPCSIWEAVILDRILSRLDSTSIASIIRPRDLFAFADESYLVLDFASQGTLLDTVNKASTMGIAPATSGGVSSLDELVVVFFAIELLRLVEQLHRTRFIHGDLKIDNCLVRLEPIPFAEGGASSWAPQYTRTGENGWRHKGIKLIDFGRAIDLSLFPAGNSQRFKADWKVDERDCLEMREDREWSFETDYFGLATICHCMLFGKYITTEVTAGPNGEERWNKVTTPLKRYWQAQLWTRLFDTLLNPHSSGQELPFNNTLQEIRGEFESWLEENCQKGGKSLKSMLKKIELAAITGRR